jgi:hypothetical protein
VQPGGIFLETVTVKTTEDNFIAAFKYALVQGHIDFGMVNFRGWEDDCNCAACRSQRIIFDYLWPTDAQHNEPINATVEAPHTK